MTSLLSYTWTVCILNFEAQICPWVWHGEALRVFFFDEAKISMEFSYLLMETLSSSTSGLSSSSKEGIL